MELTIVEHIFLSPTLSTAGDITRLTDEEIIGAQEQSKATNLLKCAGDSRYGKLIQSLKEAAYADRDEYPMSIATMYELMTKTNGSLQDSGTNATTSNRRTSCIMLVQQQYSEVNENLVPGDDGRVFGIICYNYNKHRHYASNCPDQANRIGVSNFQCGYVLSQIKDEKGLIPHDWILLGTCSTDNVINNLQLVENITSCEKDEKLKIYVNGGDLTYDEKALFKYLPLNVHFNPLSIANVLSLKQVDNMPGFHLEMNNKNGLGITLIKDGVKLKFMHSHNDLYHCTIQDIDNFYTSLLNTSKSVTLLSSREPSYSNVEVEKANRVREIQ